MSGENNSAILAHEEIQNLLKEIAENEGVHAYKLENGWNSVKGDGYSGDIASVRIVGKDDANNPKVLNLVVKSASKSDALRVELPLGMIYNREIFVYDTILPTFQKLEAEKGLSPSYLAPKFYKGSTEDKSEALILENLKECGYKLYDRRKPMDDDHVSLVMAAYGRLHALSFALRDKNAATFDKIAGAMDNGFVQYLKHSNLIDRKCISAQDALDPNTDKAALKVYKTFLDQLKPFLGELLEAPDDYSVILHGDCWTNNVMFKYEDNSNPTKPTKSCFIDFQISRPGSPVLDLSYFFYTCSSKEIIDELEHYLKLYYNSLATYLRKLGCDPEKLLPYAILQQHWKKYARYGLIMAIQVIYIMFTEKEEAIALSDVAESGKSISNAFDYRISNVDKYNDIIRHIILHFVKNKFM